MHLLDLRGARDWEGQVKGYHNLLKKERNGTEEGCDIKAWKEMIDIRNKEGSICILSCKNISELNFKFSAISKIPREYFLDSDEI